MINKLFFMKNLDPIKYHIDVLNSQADEIRVKTKNFANILINLLKKQKKLVIAGNGGSAADAQHISTELVVRMSYNRIAYPSIALTTDTSAITAIGNDFNFEKIFSRQIEAIGNQGDVFLAISTSGNSKNIINALKSAKKKKMICLGLLGNQGGQSKKFCDEIFIVNSDNPSRVQEIHIIFYHLMCSIIENSIKK
jgi:D-sedoheptulose 7-phosphate isomerase